MFPEDLAPRLLALESAFGIRRNVLIAQARWNMQREWLALGDYSDPERVDAWAKAAGVYIDRMNAEIGRATASHHVTMATILGVVAAGTQYQFDPGSVLLTRLRNDISWSGQPFRAAVNEMYYRLGRGTSFTEALRMAGNRIANVTSTSMQAASFRVTRDAGMALRAIGSVRVLSAMGNSCDHCIADAGVLHPVNTILPLHNNCRCGSRLVYGISDVSRLFDSLSDGAPVESGAYGEMFDYKVKR